MQNSKIEWTHHTYNPWWGCVKVSPGCEHCYAESFSKRTGHNIWGPAKTTTRRVFGDKHWNEPLKWDSAAKAAGERHRVFCASMADVFEEHPQVENERARLINVILNTPNLQWLLLTKRPENVMSMLELALCTLDDAGFNDLGTPEEWLARMGDRVWIGTSVEDQDRADERIPELIKIPAAIRFLSCEPLLGPLDLSGRTMETVWVDQEYADDDYLLQEVVDEDGWPIHWVIVGGESGHHSRVMHPDWARSLRDQCQAAGVAFHFKQWGEYIARLQLSKTQWEELPDAAYANAKPIDGDQVYRVGKHFAGRLLDGREWNEYPATTVKVA